ncbi:MAG: selenide, water dikinase SelD [Desulfocapsaceae bacterium]|nr:selenide, water dikinase SelD [Desulfocapsaceae bacterium]
MKAPFDLLQTVEQGGCSAKLPAQLLDTLVKGIPVLNRKELLVGSDTHDDAAVWKVDADTAIISTTDFFPPLCSDPFEFGQIAAANALSDVFAMGGTAIMALNLVMFPSSKIDIAVLKEILLGGADKVAEAGAALAGGHTIDDYPPKYGLAVTGTVHPDRIITNRRALPGEVLVLAKPIGTGTIIAGQRIGKVSAAHYQAALDGMKVLNGKGAEVMQAHGIRCATDITGFGLLGHICEMAVGSAVTIRIAGTAVPLLERAYDLTDMGCIPGASFRNLRYVDSLVHFSRGLDYNLKMLLVDAQTSGGLLLCCPPEQVGAITCALQSAGYPASAAIGRVEQKTPQFPAVIVE